MWIIQYGLYSVFMRFSDHFSYKSAISSGNVKKMSILDQFYGDSSIQLFKQSNYFDKIQQFTLIKTARKSMKFNYSLFLINSNSWQFCYKFNDFKVNRWIGMNTIQVHVIERLINNIHLNIFQFGLQLQHVWNFGVS